MKTRYLYLLRFVLGLTDLLLVNISFYATYYFVSANSGTLNDSYLQYLLVCNLLWLVSSSIFGVYTDKTIQRVEYIYSATLRSFVLHSVLFVFYLTFSRDIGFSRQFLILFYGSMSFGFLISRFMGTLFESVLKRHFNIRKSVAVLGMNTTGLRLASFFESNNNYSFEGFLNEENGLYIDAEGKILPSATEQIRVAAQNKIKEVYVSLTPDRMAEASHLLLEAEKQCVRLKFVPDLRSSFTSPFKVSYMGEFPVISVRKEPLEEIENRFKKRLFDIIFSSLVIIFIMSWLYPIIALIIKLQSPGPVLYKQLRSGRNNQPFWCYKFRSMSADKSDENKLVSSKSDPRITPIGGFLRRSSLDEFPQFFNVLLGDMSIVGPRPHPLWVNEQYNAMINQYMVRHFLKSGITGWAQVSGFRGDVNMSLMEKRIEHDIWYLENWSVMLDVKIIFMTIINVFKGEENAI